MFPDTQAAWRGVCANSFLMYHRPVRMRCTPVYTTCNAEEAGTETMAGRRELEGEEETRAAAAAPLVGGGGNGVGYGWWWCLF